MYTEKQDTEYSSDYSNPITRGKVPTPVKFVIGGLSGATGQIATHPMDVIKIHKHMTKSSLYATARQAIDGPSGWRGLYIGLTAGLLRQITYSTTRLGIYNSTVEMCRDRFGRLNYPALVSIGMMSGILGALVGTPADLVMIRMITDVKKTPDRRRNYTDAIGGLSRIIRDEGYLRLWRGAVPTMGRAAIVNGAQLGTYSRTKMFLRETKLIKEGLVLQFCASMMSSIVTCTASIPVDLAKTEYVMLVFIIGLLYVLLVSWHGPEKPPGLVAAITHMVRTDGFFSLWRGLLPYYLRAGPNTIITMVTMDQLATRYASVFS